jgi:hypothetical protein
MGKVCTATAGWALSAELTGAIRQPIFYVGGTNNFLAVPGIDLANNATHTLAGVYDGTNASVYVDGNLVAGPTAKTGALNGGGLITYIGGDGIFEGRTTGNIHDAKVFPYALTPVEIRSLHERSLMQINL